MDTRAVSERLVAFVKIFPEVADIVIEVGDDLQPAVFVGHAPKLRHKHVLSVRRFHLQGVDIEKGVEHLMRNVQLDEISFRNRPL
jgi:hypothetical protein